jgi:hypothetical protein
MSRRGRLGFVAVCVLAFVLIAALISWGRSSTGPSRPAGLAVTDLNDVGQLQARFNADQGVPRLVLALAPT